MLNLTLLAHALSQALLHSPKSGTASPVEVYDTCPKDWHPKTNKTDDPWRRQGKRRARRRK